MSVLDRKLHRDIWHSSGLLTAIGTIIAVGVCCYICMGAAYQNLTTALADYYTQCRMADCWIELKKVPIAELGVLERLPGIVDYRTRIQSAVTVDLPYRTEPLNGLVISMPDQRKPVINDLLLRKGSYFTNRHEAEVIVNDAFAKKHHLVPGSKFHIILNNRRQELFVVGTAISSEFIYLVGKSGIIPDPEHFGVFYLKRSYMEDVFDFQGACNQVVGKLSPEFRDHPEPILDQVENLLEPYGVFTTIPRRDQASHRFVDGEIEQLATQAYVMPGIFLAVAALVLNVLMSRLIDQQRTIIGTLKALGYSDVSILFHYIKFGLTVGLIGGGIGDVLGFGLAELLTNGVYQEFFEFPNLTNRIYPLIYGNGIFISVLCSLSGVLHGAWMVLQLKPASAMRPKPPRTGGAIFLEHITWFWNRLDTGWRMALRNVVRNYTRTGIGIFAASMGSCLLVATFISNRSVIHLIDFQFHQVMRSDIDLAFEGERTIDALREAERLPGVDYAEPTLNVAVTFHHGPYQQRGGITGLIPQSQLTVPRDESGRRIRVPETGLVMGKALADKLNIQRGDRIIIHPIKGLRRDREVTVVGVSQGYIGLSCYANIHYLSRLVNEEYAINGVQLKINPEPNQKRILRSYLKELSALETYTAREDIIRSLEETFVDMQLVSIGILVLFSGVIFFGSTLNAALIGLAERQREVATLLVLGYDPGYVSRLFLREALLINIIGTVVGLPLGYLLIKAAFEAAATDFVRVPIIAPPITWLLTLVIGVTFCFAAQYFVQRSIHQMDWLEKLKTQE